MVTPRAALHKRGAISVTFNPEHVGLRHLYFCPFGAVAAMASGFSSDQVEKAKEAIGILSSIINPVQDEQVRHVYLYFCYL